MPNAYNINEELLAAIFNSINPNNREGECFWAALEGAKVLLNIKNGSDDIMPTLDISQILPGQDKACHEQIKAYRKEKIKFEAVEEFLDWLQKLESNTVMIVGNSEGDHSYNIFKTSNNMIWLIDSDRQTYFQITPEMKNLHFTISGWNADNNGEFDYFKCEFTHNRDAGAAPTLNVNIMADELLQSTYTPRLHSKKSEPQIQSQATIELQKKLQQIYDENVGSGICKIGIKKFSSNTDIGTTYFRIDIIIDSQRLDLKGEKKFMDVSELLTANSYVHSYAENESATNPGIYLLIKQTNLKEFSDNLPVIGEPSLRPNSGL